MLTMHGDSELVDLDSEQTLVATPDGAAAQRNGGSVSNDTMSGAYLDMTASMSFARTATARSSTRRRASASIPHAC